MPTTITLAIAVELPELLIKKAAEEGVQVEQFAVDALKRVVQMPAVSELFADRSAEFEASGMTDEELRPGIGEPLAEVILQRRVE